MVTGSRLIDNCSDVIRILEQIEQLRVIVTQRYRGNFRVDVEEGIAIYIDQIVTETSRIIDGTLISVWKVRGLQFSRQFSRIGFRIGGFDT